MEYLALYRKYRPNELCDVSGQNEIKQILATSVKNNTITHAYLFSGPRGTGKTTMAKILAKMVNCESPVDGDACNQCDSCLNILKSNDVIEIDAASNNGVDEIRDLREKANLVPIKAKYKIYIIDEVHMLTTQAFNALLKTLEEPPKHVIFILATTEFYKIPLTITSRCQKFQFNKLKHEEIVDRLKYIANNEKIKISEAAIAEIAKISDGGMRDAINFLDQLRSFSTKKIEIEDVYSVCGSISNYDIVDLLTTIKNSDTESMVSFFEKMDNIGKNYGKFLEDLVLFLKDIILLDRNVNNKYIVSDYECLTKVNTLFSIDEILYFIEKINNMSNNLKNVSRQSVYVLTNFLQVMNNIGIESENVSNTNINIEKEASDDNINSTTISDNEIVKNKGTIGKKVVDEINNIIKVDTESIINNTFAVANKEVKIELQNKMCQINDYLTNKKYKNIAGLLIDTKIEVAGDKYVLFSTKSAAIIEKINDNYELCVELLNELFDGEYAFAIVSDDEWIKYRDEYIENTRKGKKYTLIDVNKEEKKIRKSSKKATVVDKLFELVGEDNIEFK